MQINLNNSSLITNSKDFKTKSTKNSLQQEFSTLIIKAQKPQKIIQPTFSTFITDLLAFPLIIGLKILNIITTTSISTLSITQQLYKKLKFILFARGKSRKLATINIAILHTAILILIYLLTNRLYTSAKNINYLVSTKHPPLLISQADGYLKQDIEIDILNQNNQLLAQTQTKLNKINAPFIKYKIMPGDTIYTIAVRYGITTTTLINANNIKNPNYLKIGQILIVPLQNGILYKTKKGDTLAKIAKKYKISIQKLAQANNLKSNQKINSGKTLLIPGVQPKPVYAQKRTSTISNTRTSITKRYGTGSYFSGTGGACSFALKYAGYGLHNYKVRPAVRYTHFIKYNPIAGSFRIGAGFAGYRWGTYYWHSGVDYVARYGTPIIAVADGIINRMGYQYGGYGNYIKIYHPQVGMYTLYGHMSRFYPGIHIGTHVKAGQIIGYVGNTGLAYGAHLHFEVIDRNRLRYNPGCFR